VALFSGFATLFVLMTFVTPDDNNSKKTSPDTRKRPPNRGFFTPRKSSPSPTTARTTSTSTLPSSETRPRSTSFVDASLLNDSPISPQHSPPVSPTAFPSPPPNFNFAPPLLSESPATLAEAVIIIESLKEFTRSEVSSHQSCTNAERKGRLSAERRLEAERLHVTELMEEIEWHKQHTVKSIATKKNVQKLLEDLESTMGFIVDKMQSTVVVGDKQDNDGDFALSITFNAAEALRVEKLLKVIQEKKDFLEQEILEASLQKVKKRG